MRTVRSSFCIIMLCTIASTLDASFQAGDLYLVTNSLENPSGVGSIPGVLQINQQTGATTLLGYLPDSIGSDAVTYDPYRDRIIMKIGALGTSLLMMDSTGAMEPLPTTYGGTVEDLAATGDGRLYMLDAAFIVYLDAAGATHTFLNADGVTAFNPQLLNSHGVMIYDVLRNALVIVDYHTSVGTRIRSVPISADGSRVDGRIAETTASLISSASDWPTSLCAGPAGSVFYKIDDNSGTLQPRMQLIDPATLAASPYAWSQYFGVGGEVAGCYSSVRDQAVVLDSLSDNLRVFSQGSSGEGVIFATGVSWSGSGEAARLLEIGGTLIGGTHCIGDFVSSATFMPPGDGMVDGADLAVLLGDWGANAGSPADIVDSVTFAPPGDGVVNGADLAVLLGAWGDCG